MYCDSVVSMSRGALCPGLRYKVRFDAKEFLCRVHFCDESIPIPAAATVCAPVSCTPEMVGRFVFPQFHIPGFDVRNMAGWPKLDTEVFVGTVAFPECVVRIPFKFF